MDQAMIIEKSKTHDEINYAVRRFIHENFLLEDGCTPEETISLLESGIIDSTGVLELVAFVEKTYRFKVEEEELIPENLDTIKNIVNFIARRLG
jgi:acyl carrier protein